MHNRRPKSAVFVAAAAIMFCGTEIVPGRCMAGDELVALAVAADGKAACALVVAGGSENKTLMDKAAATIADTIIRWSSVQLPVTALKDDARELPAGAAIVLCTLERLHGLAPQVESANADLLKLADDHGYACLPAGDKVFVVAKAPRGVYNGAVYLSDFCTDGAGERLSVSLKPILRNPKLQGRASYTLTIWKDESMLTVDNWKTTFDCFAYNGIDRVYFWLSGHFPSKKFPQAYRCADGNYDRTVESAIGTVEDQRALIKHAHDLGMRFYIGGGLGAWCGTVMLTNFEKDTMKQGPGARSRCLCPSSPVSRRALIDYYTEIFDALPEADGIYIEMADECGHCGCPECRKLVDKLGSRQYGQSQITLVQELARKVWENHPQARFSFTVGYTEHKKDPAFYKAVKEMSKDERFEWMEARGTWEFPGPDGQPLPGTEFSNRLMHWQQYYNATLEGVVASANLIGKNGWYGIIQSYEPGFNSGTRPKLSARAFNPTVLPYALTGFVFREMSWEPAMTVEQMRGLVQKRFFGGEAPEQLGADLWMLREVRRAGFATPEQMAAIEEHIKAARAKAGPKTLEGIALMQQAVDAYKAAAAPTTQSQPK